jgi:HEAT repeat protein
MTRSEPAAPRQNPRGGSDLRVKPPRRPADLSTQRCRNMGPDDSVAAMNAELLRAQRRERVRKALADPDPEVRAAASRALERLDRRRDLDLLLARLASADVRDRVEAVYGIGAIGDPGVVGPLVTALRDPVEDVRAAAVRMLAELRDGAGLSPIAQCLDDPSALVRRHAIDALGRFADRRVVPLLLTMLKEPEVETVAPALRALGLCRDPEAEPHVAPFLAHPSPIVRAAALEALAQLD